MLLLNVQYRNDGGAVTFSVSPIVCAPLGQLEL